jgi:hypothetical protein
MSRKPSAAGSSAFLCGRIGRFAPQDDAAGSILPCDQKRQAGQMINSKVPKITLGPAD